MPSAAEHNFTEFLVSMGRAGGGSVRRDDLVTWTVGGSPLSYHNAVAGCSASTFREAATLIAEFLGELQAHDLAGSWHLSPSMGPAGLEGLLIDAGFRLDATEPMMTLDLTAPAEPAPLSLSLSIDVVRDLAGIERYGSVLADGFGEGPPEVAWVTETFSTIGFDGPWRHLVGSEGDTPVATASLLLTDETAGLYFVATHPEHRRRGFGSEITRAAVETARQAGATTVVLGSSSMAHPLYRALGFVDVVEHRIYEWQRPES